MWKRSDEQQWFFPRLLVRFSGTFPTDSHIYHNQKNQCHWWREMAYSKITQRQSSPFTSNQPTHLPLTCPWPAVFLSVSPSFCISRIWRAVAPHPGTPTTPPFLPSGPWAQHPPVAPWPPPRILRALKEIHLSPETPLPPSLVTTSDCWTKATAARKTFVWCWNCCTLR